jgi:hypothetical protein
MHNLLSAVTMADFGMALPYFTEIVELRETKTVYGLQVAQSVIGQVFGKHAVVVTGKAPDGQTWRAIYPHETSDCWATPEPYDTPVVLDEVINEKIDRGAMAVSWSINSRQPPMQ